jgi:hypothetical protein
MREARQQAAQAQQGMAAMQQMAATAKDAVPAAAQARESGLVDQLQGMLPGAQ